MELQTQSDRIGKGQKYHSVNQIRNKQPAVIPEQANDQQMKKARKIKKLMIMNQQLVETLKKQDQQLTRRIRQQKNRPQNRSFSVRQKPVIARQSESTKKQLSNAYKQIKVYKNIVQDIKQKQMSGDAIDKIKILQGKITMEEKSIQKLQIELRTISNRRDNQVKQLKNYQTDRLKQTVVSLQQKATRLRDQYKKNKKQVSDREQIDQRLQKYQIQLQKNLRQANNKFFPGINQKKNASEQEIFANVNISEKQWKIVKTELQQMKRLNQQYIKKQDMIHRMKLKQFKSYDQNQLKIKQKNRVLLNLQNKIRQMTKLTIYKQGQQEEEEEQQQQNNQTKNIKPKTKEQLIKEAKQKAIKRNSNNIARQVKKWAIPQGYCLQRGKILPDSIFFSDKPILKDVKKSKIESVNVWTDDYGIPNAIQFFYKDQNGLAYEGIQPIESLPQTLNLISWKLTEGDYLYSVSGQFLDTQLSCLNLKSKFGKQITFRNQNSTQKGDAFKFEPKPNQIPSCFFGAYVQNQTDNFRICHIGCEFMQDW